MIPTRIIPFLAVLLGMLLVAHLAVRWFARGADATLLPLAALLHGLGYVMITRLDERLAGLQTTWSIVAIVVFVLTLVVVQRAPDLARYRWLLPVRRHRPADAAARPGRSASASAAPASGSTSGRSTSSPASSPSWRWPSSSPATSPRTAS